MTHEEFISIVRKPELVKNEHVLDLKELVDLYPYFAPARLFHAKALKQSNNIQFGANIKVASLYGSSRRWLYYYLYPEKLLSEEPYVRERNLKSSGDYFDMIDVVESEGGDTNQSLKNLAERLKLAREIVSSPETKVRKPEKVTEKPVISFSKENYLEIEPKPNDSIASEKNAKKLISERKYKEAIEILKALNLNNPKKSVYFADQIRFLEKVIANSKK